MTHARKTHGGTFGAGAPTFAHIVAALRPPNGVSSVAAAPDGPKVPATSSSPVRPWSSPSANSRSSSAAPASLAIDPWKREPDTRSGAKPEALKGTLTATELTAGAQYDIYRWDSVAAALTYDAQYKKATFAAVGTTYVYADDKSFQSNSTTYYRVVRAE